jgi:hypothetical protein
MIEQETIKNTKGIAPQTMIDRIKTELRYLYLFDESINNCLIVQNSVRNPLFTVYSDGIDVHIGTTNPMLMDEVEEREFYQLVTRIVTTY